MAVTIKLQYIRNLIFVPAYIKGKTNKANLSCVVDPGTTITTVKAEIIDMLGYSAKDGENISKATSATGEGTPSYTLKVKNFIIDQIQRNDLLVDVIDLADSPKYPRIDCLIGNNFLDNYKVTIDYKNELLTLE